MRFCKIHLVAQTASSHHRIAFVDRYGNETVERNFALIIGYQHFALIVDLFEVEIGDDVDVLFLQQTSEHLRGPGLGECPRHRRDIGDVHIFPHAALHEKGIGKHDEFKRRHRAFDGQIGDVQHEFTTLPCFEEVGQGRCPLNGIEIEDLLLPKRTL